MSAESSLRGRGTTRIFGFANSFLRYASTFLSSWTSTGPPWVAYRFSCRNLAQNTGSSVREHLVHAAGGFRAQRIADDLRRHPGDGDIVRNRFQHHRAGRHAGTTTDLDVAQDLGAGADQHALANLGMAIAVFLAGAAQSDILEHRHVVLDHRGLSDHQPCGVVEENAAADPGGRMDVALEHGRRPAL